MMCAMSTPSTLIYVRPGAASHTWSYAGNTLPSGASESKVAAVAFDASGAPGQAASRGDLQYSADNGKTWTTYMLPADGQGAWVAAGGALWRFQDRAGGDSTTPDSFNAHYQLLDGSVATALTTVLADSQPVGLTGSYDTLFSTMAAGDVVDLLYGIDTGAQTGGRWVIDSQSVPGLFAISYNPALDAGGKLVVASPSLLPASGQAAAVTVHYYDRYQVDADGNPIASTGVTRTLNYTVEDGSTRDLAGFTDESKLGAATAAANPALATLSTGGFVAVWQGADTVRGGAGAGLWAQLRDAAGNPLGGAFALTPAGDARLEGQPAVSSLAGGRFVVAYTVNEGGASKIAYRVVEANGTAGVEHVLDLGTSDAAMPAVATLSDGSIVVGWRSGGAVHVQQAAADGALLGAGQVYGALGSAYSPSLAALQQGGYVVSWGEINDGNVYAAIRSSSAAGSPFVVNGDGYAASISTAAPLPHLAALANGGFVAAWDSYVNDPHGFSISDIYYQVHDGAGHALGPISQANVDSGGGRYDAAVAALSDGGFVITWQGEDGDGNGIFGRRFGFDGGALDQHEFAVSQLRAGDQSAPDVAALASGGFATAWIDTAADGGTGVEARVLQGLAGPSVVLQGGSQGADMGNVPAATLPGPAPTATEPASTAPVASISGSAVRDALVVPAGNSVLDGGSGLDTAVFGGIRAAYTVHKNGSGFVVDGLDGSHAVLSSVERLQFADQMVGLDSKGIGGQALRLFQAAFAHSADLGGLGYWIGIMDSLGQSLEKAATGSAGSQVLTHFSESAGSQAEVVGSIQNGFDPIHYG
jgi:hypothetical protein